MRINVYTEELPDFGDVRAVERVQKTVNGKTFHGARLYLRSPGSLHDRPDDDDRSAVTIWGPRATVATLLRRMAHAMDGLGDIPVGGGREIVGDES